MPAWATVSPIARGVESREVNSYPARLGRLAGGGYDVRNFGVGGAEILRNASWKEGGWNSSYWEADEYKKALEFRPNLVLIKLGTNDSNPTSEPRLDSQFVRDYKDLIASFRALPTHPKVVILLPVPFYPRSAKGSDPENRPQMMKKVNALIQQVAAETGCEVIDLYNLLKDTPELFPDKVHPNATGATIIANRVYEFLKTQQIIK